MRACKFAVISALALSAAIQWAGAEAKPNPYGPIIDRNPFGLKPPPAPVVETNQEPAAPPPNVKLTGISNLFAKRALLEITEQQGPSRPGQPPPPGGTVNRPILAEGEAMHGVEVVAIDLEKNRVRIRNAGTESELTFEVPKLSGGGPTGPPTPGRPGQPMASVNPNVPAAAAQPTVITPSNAQGAGRGVSLYGGGNAATTANSGVTTLGGAAQMPSPLGADSGLRTIPSRTIRTPNNPDQQQIDPAQQQILMEANRLQQQQQPTYNRRGRPTIQPPLPPTDLTPPSPQPQ